MVLKTRHEIVLTWPITMRVVSGVKMRLRSFWRLNLSLVQEGPNCERSKGVQSHDLFYS